jgi:hypothetical protein
LPASVDTRYEIGSVSKQFLAAAMMLLEEDGKLSLDDRVGRFLPELTRANDVTNSPASLTYFWVSRLPAARLHGAVHSGTGHVRRNPGSLGPRYPSISSPAPSGSIATPTIRLPHPF